MKKSPKKTTKKRMTIEDLARIFAGEFSRVHEEFKDVRAEFREGLEKVNGRIDGVQDEMRAGFQKTDDRFDDVDKRFDSLEAGTHRRLTIVETTLKTLAKN